MLTAEFEMGTSEFLKKTLKSCGAAASIKPKARLCEPWVQIYKWFRATEWD